MVFFFSKVSYIFIILKQKRFCKRIWFRVAFGVIKCLFSLFCTVKRKKKKELTSSLGFNNMIFFLISSTLAHLVS